jgi:hypothetical protein
MKKEVFFRLKISKKICLMLMLLFYCDLKSNENVPNTFPWKKLRLIPYKCLVNNCMTPNNYFPGFFLIPFSHFPFSSKLFEFRSKQNKTKQNRVSAIKCCCQHLPFFLLPVVRYKNLSLSVKRQINKKLTIYQSPRWHLLSKYWIF